MKTVKEVTTGIAVTCLRQITREDTEYRSDEEMKTFVGHVDSKIRLYNMNTKNNDIIRTFQGHSNRNKITSLAIFYDASIFSTFHQFFLV